MGDELDQYVYPCQRLGIHVKVATSGRLLELNHRSLNVFLFSSPTECFRQSRFPRILLSEKSDVGAVVDFVEACDVLGLDH